MYCRVHGYVSILVSYLYAYDNTGLGFIVGPTAGASAWRFAKGSSIKAFDARDAEFYQRIAKNRVDATLQSPTSPVPDYYGGFTSQCLLYTLLTPFDR